MKKKKLGSLPVLAASCADVEMMNCRENLKWLIKAEECRVSDQSHLIVNFYYREDLLNGCLQPQFRIFFQKNAYITQCWEENNRDFFWKTGAWEHYIYIPWKPEIASATEQDEEKIKCFLGYSKGTGIDAIDAFQYRLIGEKRKRRYEQIMQRIDAAMVGIEPEPEEFVEWIKDSFMVHSRYFFYQYSEHKQENGICSCCGKESLIDRKRIRYGKSLECPNCRKTVKALSVKKMPSRIWDCSWCFLLQKVNGALVFRGFEVDKRYTSAAPGMAKVTYKERVRYFYRNGTWDAYHWDFFKSSGKLRWCDGLGTYADIIGAIYPVGIKDALEGTAYRYCGLEEFSKSGEERFFSIIDYLTTYQKFPFIEKLAKCNFTELIDSLMKYKGAYGGQIFKADESELYKIMKLEKGYFKCLPSDISLDTLKFVQHCCERHVSVDHELIRLCEKYYACDSKLLDYIKYASINKIVDYCGTLGCQTESYRWYEQKNRIRSWLDYLGWCEELGYDLKDKYYLFPKNFPAAHDRLEREYEEFQNKKLKRKISADRRKATRRLKKMSEQVGEISRGNLQLIVPKNAAEIVEEGRKLHHCVATYIPRIASDSTMVLFLRKKDHPEQPYRTLEWKQGRFMQCQGRSNSEENGKEITDFLAYAQEKLNQRLIEKHAA